MAKTCSGDSRDIRVNAELGYNEAQPFLWMSSSRRRLAGSASGGVQSKHAAIRRPGKTGPIAQVCQRLTSLTSHAQCDRDGCSAIAILWPVDAHFALGIGLTLTFVPTISTFSRIQLGILIVGHLAQSFGGVVTLPREISSHAVALAFFNLVPDPLIVQSCPGRKCSRSHC
jgi:hypothetical protein